MSKAGVLQRMRSTEGYGVSDACFAISMRTGVITAGAVANSVWFSMKPALSLNPNLDGNPSLLFIERIRVHYTCITAFTTPVVAGRRLVMCRGVLDPVGGTALGLNEPAKMGGSNQLSLFVQTLGASPGHMHIANTTPLTTVVAVPDQARLFDLSLANLGNAGASARFDFDYRDDPVGMSQLGGQLASIQQLVLCNPVAMDAGGTFELVIEIETCELPRTFVIPPA